jgi:DNA-binding HxlR family transcriptional regulator
MVGMRESKKRTYDDGCAAAHALDLVGERWALLVVRELLLGPKRFTDLRRSLVSISPNVLTQRLTELESGGVLTKRKLPAPVAVWVYELSEWGEQLEPVIRALSSWGARSPMRPHEGRLSVDSLVLSFRVTFDPRKAADFTGRLELRLGDDVNIASALANVFMTLADNKVTLVSIRSMGQATEQAFLDLVEREESRGFARAYQPEAA